eukprot:1286406-Ditylum_brightwellii.AAC.1
MHLSSFYDEVWAVIMRMTYDKSPGLLSMTSDVFRAMVWCKADPTKEVLNTHTKFLCNYVTENL